MTRIDCNIMARNAQCIYYTYTVRNFKRLNVATIYYTVQYKYIYIMHRIERVLQHIIRYANNAIYSLLVKHVVLIWVTEQVKMLKRVLLRDFYTTVKVARKMRNRAVIHFYTV